MLDVVVRTLIQYEYGTRVGIDHGGNITLGSICRRALNSAQFWEMRNIRSKCNNDLSSVISTLTHTFCSYPIEYPRSEMSGFASY